MPDSTLKKVAGFIAKTCNRPGSRHRDKTYGNKVIFKIATQKKEYKHTQEAEKNVTAGLSSDWKSMLSLLTPDNDVKAIQLPASVQQWRFSNDKR